MSQVTLSGSSGEDDESPWLGGRLPNGAEPAPVLGRGFLELHHWFQPGPNAPPCVRNGRSGAWVWMLTFCCLAGRLLGVFWAVHVFALLLFGLSALPSCLCRLPLLLRRRSLRRFGRSSLASHVR